MHIRAIQPAIKLITPRLFALILAALLVVESTVPLQAQLASAPPQGLQIMILDGEGALNNIRERTAREPIVQVQDENHKPVAGVLILFTIHGGSSGASATFANGLTTLSVTTDAEGKAVAHGMQVNQTTGAWQISVSATYGSLTASTVINQNNVAPLAPRPEQAQPNIGVVHVPWYFSKPVLFLGGAIVAGSVAAVIAVKADQGTTINIGTTTVGAPSVRPGIRFSFGRK